MTKEITMPRLSETMPDGKILVWYKKPNDEVSKGEVIAEVETDKANMEIEAVDSGVLAEVLVPVGGIAKVGEPIAILNGKRDITPQKEQFAAMLKETEAIEEEKPERAQKQEEERSEIAKRHEEKPSGLKASLLIRELAAKLNVNLAEIKGTGPDGQIKRSDVLMAALKNSDEKGILQADTVAGEEEPLTRIRQTIASRMTYSKQHIPHFYLTSEVDAGRLVEYRNNFRQKIEGITYNDIFIKAIALVLKRYPRLNASFKGDFINIKNEINIGIAFATEKGLLVPVVHNCDSKSLAEIHEATSSIKKRVKEDKLKPEDMTGGTFTVSNLGMYGVKEFMAIINPPEAAGIAIGAILNNRINITLSGDHRVIDGAEGALFMNDLKNILEKPEEIEQIQG